MKNVIVLISLVAATAALFAVSKSFRRLVMVLAVMIGCAYSPADEYVKDHTEHDWYDDNQSGYVIDLLMEESDDYRLGVVSSKDLLDAEKAAYEESGSKYDELRTVTIWVSTSLDSWNAFNSISPDGSENYEDTACVFFESYELDDFVVAISPTIWRSSDKEIFMYYFVHELVHYISSQEHDGDSDHNHIREGYWGPGGLLERILERLFV